ncbi:unnamed protein product [Polarella glacialis]|uniref:Uncharacterized protein n=1 Tax=Polarella glacialis TaxID=89957 RepID=A0A813FP10_POLGL|nr:unnamed protein product [Polarella glacialis]
MAAQELPPGAAPPGAYGAYDYVAYAAQAAAYAAAYGAPPGYPGAAAYGAPAVYGQPPAAYGQPPAMYGQPPAAYGQPPAVYGQPPAGYGYPPPVYGGQPMAVYGQPPPAAPQTAGGNARPGDWNCASCGDLQFAKNSSCRRCGAAKLEGASMSAPAAAAAAAAMRPGDWTCPSCNDHVFAKNDECRRCRTQRPEGAASVPGSVASRAPAQVARDGDWNCRGCGDLQFARNGTCRRCGQEKPSDAGLSPAVATAPVAVQGAKSDLRPGDWVCPRCNAVAFAVILVQPSQALRVGHGTGTPWGGSACDLTGLFGSGMSSEVTAAASLLGRCSNLPVLYQPFTSPASAWLFRSSLLRLPEDWDATQYSLLVHRAAVAFARRPAVPSQKGPPRGYAEEFRNVKVVPGPWVVDAFLAFSQPKSRLLHCVASFLIRRALSWMHLTVVIDIASLESVTDLQAPLVLCPNHRSLLDFVLIGVTCFQLQPLLPALQIPKVAADAEFASLPFLGRALAALGAFFVRRGGGSVQPDPALRAKVGGAFHGGRPLEVFLEGLRSRGRRQMRLRTGLLRALRDVSQRTVAIVPLALSYELLPEDASFYDEMSGLPRPPLRTGALLHWAFRGMRGELPPLGEARLRLGVPRTLDASTDLGQVVAGVQQQLVELTSLTTLHARALAELLELPPDAVTAALRNGGLMVRDSSLSATAPLPEQERWPLALQAATLTPLRKKLPPQWVGSSVVFDRLQKRLDELLDFKLCSHSRANHAQANANRSLVVSSPRRSAWSAGPVRAAASASALPSGGGASLTKWWMKCGSTGTYTREGLNHRWLCCCRLHVSSLVCWLLVCLQLFSSVLFGSLRAILSFSVYLVYHLDILVGTPGQTQSVIIDTGSSLAAFPCVSCGASCGTHIDPPFDPASSSTFKWVSCSPPGCAYEVNYLEGSSIKGQLFEDFLQVGHAVRQNSRTPVWLGCHSLETNLFKTQAPSGILGLWGNSWDVLEALASGGPLKRQLVALCFAESGGAMSIGGINETWTTLLKPMIWIAYTGHFNVPVTDISLVGGAAGKSESVLGSVGSFLVDSGTTFTYFTQQQSSALENAVRSACPAGRCGAAVPSAAGNCWDLDEADLDKFPSLRLTIGTGTVDWSARGYLYHKGGEGRRWCFAFFGEPPLTLGASFLKHHLVVFDRDEGLLGFAPAICPEAVSREDDVDFIPLSAGSNGTSSNQYQLPVSLWESAPTPPTEDAATPWSEQKLGGAEAVLDLAAVASAFAAQMLAAEAAAEAAVQVLRDSGIAKVTEEHLLQELLLPGSKGCGCLPPPLARGAASIVAARHAPATLLGCGLPDVTSGGGSGSRKKPQSVAPLWPSASPSSQKRDDGEALERWGFKDTRFVADWVDGKPAVQITSRRYPGLGAQPLFQLWSFFQTQPDA